MLINRAKQYIYSSPLLVMLFIVTMYREKTSGYEGIVGSYGLQKITILFLIIFSIFLISLNINDALKILRGRLIYILFLIYITLSIFWSDNPTSAFRISMYFWGVAVICLTAVIAFKNDPTKIFTILIVYSIVMICGSLVVVYLFPHKGVSESGRWIGITNHANILGIISIISIWANFCYLFISKSLAMKIFSIMMILLSLLCIYGANSITSFLVSVGILFLVFSLRGYSQDRLLRLFAQVILVFFFLLFAAFFLYLILPEVISVEMLFKVLGRDTTFTGRTVLWEHGLNIFYQQPIIGKGFQEYINVGGGERIKHFHNGYIELMVRGGVIGLLFMMVIIIQTIYLYKRVLDFKVYVFFLIMVIAIMIHNITEGSFGRGVTPLWLLFSYIYFYKDYGYMNKSKYT